MTENPKCLLRAGIKEGLTDLKPCYGKAELLGIWLPGGVQNPEARVKIPSFAGGSVWQELSQLPGTEFYVITKRTLVKQPPMPF